MERERGQTEPSWAEPRYAEPSLIAPQVQPSFVPAGEMIGERMEWDSPYQARAAYDMNFPSNTWFDEREAAAQAAAQEAAIADMGRTTTMGTGWGRQPLIDPPPTYDYAGTGGLEGLPLSPFIPTANTLLPPVNQEMIGNWGGGAANRQEWTGPLGVSPLTGPWATFLNPPPPWENYGSIFYNYEHPNWYDVQKSRQLDRYGDVQNFASNYWPYLVNPTSHLINQGIQNNDWLNNLYGNIRSRGY